MLVVNITRTTFFSILGFRVDFPFNPVFVGNHFFALTFMTTLRHLQARNSKLENFDMSRAIWIMLSNMKMFYQPHHTYDIANNNQKCSLRTCRLSYFPIRSVIEKRGSNERGKHRKPLAYRTIKLHVTLP